MNNLNELNTVLFEALRSVNADKMQHKKAAIICNIGSTIINNAKVQLQASKMLKGGALETEFFGVLKSHEGRVSDKIKMDMKNDSVYDRKLEFAYFLGHKSLAEAISALGINRFELDFKDFTKKDND